MGIFSLRKETNAVMRLNRGGCGKTRLRTEPCESREPRFFVGPEFTDGTSLTLCEPQLPNTDLVHRKDGISWLLCQVRLPNGETVRGWLKKEYTRPVMTGQSVYALRDGKDAETQLRSEPTSLKVGFIDPAIPNGHELEICGPDRKHTNNVFFQDGGRIRWLLVRPRGSDICGWIQEKHTCKNLPLGGHAVGGGHHHGGGGHHHVGGGHHHVGGGHHHVGGGHHHGGGGHHHGGGGHHHVGGGGGHHHVGGGGGQSFGHHIGGGGGQVIIVDPLGMLLQPQVGKLQMQFW
jgi:hypothetical protein